MGDHTDPKETAADPKAHVAEDDADLKKKLADADQDFGIAQEGNSDKPSVGVADRPEAVVVTREDVDAAVVQYIPQAPSVYDAPPGSKPLMNLLRREPAADATAHTREEEGAGIAGELLDRSIPRGLWNLHAHRVPLRQVWGSHDAAKDQSGIPRDRPSDPELMYRRSEHNGGNFTNRTGTSRRSKAS